MTMNLFVAYDLTTPGQNYEAVRTRVKSLGQWYQAQYSLFYLHTRMSLVEVHDSIRGVMDANDKLVVIDARAAKMTPCPQTDIEEINKVWLAA
jgi:hypothetical protein